MKLGSDIWRRRAGLPPGTVSSPQTSKRSAKIDALQYGGGQGASYEQVDPSAPPHPEKDRILWIDVDYHGDTESLRLLGKSLGWHPLQVEDLINGEQRPKAERSGAYVFLGLDHVRWDEESGSLQTVPYRVGFTKGTLVTVTPEKDALIDLIRRRIESEAGIIVENGADYLAYALFDVLVDDAMASIEYIDEQIEALQEALLTDPSTTIPADLHNLRREVIQLRRSVRPLREVVVFLEDLTGEVIETKLRPYLRDLRDHITQAIEGADILRELLSSLTDVYLSSINNRMSTVMKVLALIGTIFIPLSFLAGVYGMNFSRMPGLASPAGFWFAVGGMGIVGGGMLVYFKIRRWF